MNKLFAILMILFCVPVFGQDEDLRYTDHVYVDNIKAIQFFVGDLVLTNPIIDLRANTQMYLSFDDMDDVVKTYTYTFVHCNADWTPSGLTETEYINGFTESYIEDYEYSINTVTPYVQYSLFFPNRDFNFMISGNYLLKVYEDEDERKLAITRRMMVVDPFLKVVPQMARTGMVSKSTTHQELDFVVLTPDANLRSPMVEIKATILQNGRWDNAVQGIAPKFTRREELVFDYQDKIVFEAGNEFRYTDLRSFQYPDNKIYSVERYEDGYDVTMLTDEKTARNLYSNQVDLNGKFFITNTDFRNPSLSSDYANVLFSLRSPTEYYDSEMYVFGALTDWELKEEFKMTYSPQREVYVTEATLKQGFYDYQYVLVGKDGKPDISLTEGNWNQTNNFYTILIYYRPFGGRYDQLIAVDVIESNF